jgi:hypothetical protein
MNQIVRRGGLRACYHPAARARDGRPPAPHITNRAVGHAAARRRTGKAARMACLVRPERPLIGRSGQPTATASLDPSRRRGGSATSGHLVRLEGRAMLPALLLDRTKSGDRVTLTAIDSAPGQAPSPRAPKAIFKMPFEDQMICPTPPRTG